MITPTLLGNPDVAPFDKDIAGLSATFMLVETFVYFILVLVIEHVQRTPELEAKVRGCWHSFINLLCPGAPPQEAQVDLFFIHTIYSEEMSLSGLSGLLRLLRLLRLYTPGCPNPSVCLS